MANFFFIKTHIWKVKIIFVAKVWQNEAKHLFIVQSFDILHSVKPV